MPSAKRAWPCCRTAAQTDRAPTRSTGRPSWRRATEDLGGLRFARELGREIDDIKKKLAELAPKQESRTELRIALQAGSDLEAELKLMYQVSNAYWTPFYEARLTSGTDAKEPGLDLTRRASITQQTGEAWQDVALDVDQLRLVALPD